MKKYYLGFIALTLFTSCEKKQQAQFHRAEEPWAIRSVLDYQPRMLTLALDSSMYVAYDLEHCRFYKAWKGGVNWDGIVFNDTKVIQPTSWGSDYVSSSPQDGWWWQIEGEQVKANAHFLGYEFRDGQVYLSYNLVTDRDTVMIVERPEYYQGSDHNPGLERVFFRTGSSTLPVFLKTQSQVLQLDQHEQVLRTEFDRLPKQIQEETPVRTDNKGRYWIEKSDCPTCHEWSENTVGPGFEQIARKYADTEEVMSYLVGKVKHGGSGVWGTTLMNPHPDLPDEDIALMIEFILTLHGRQDNLDQQVASGPEVAEEPAHKPGFGSPLIGLHPSYDLQDLEPAGYDFTVGGLAFFPDGRLLVTTWSPQGAVYVLDGVQSGDPDQITVTQIAQGLSEPLGAAIVDNEIYVLQKHELTKLIDHNGDQIIDEYQAVCNGFGVSTDFHEFAFGLIYRDNHFYANLSIPMRLMVNEKPLPDRGRTVKIAMNGTFEHLNHGLRQPNGIGFGVDDQIFVTDNQGQWLPGNKLIHVSKGAFHGMRWVLADSLKDIEETPPAVWLPQDEIANSPSQPAVLNDGPYKGQMIYGDVSHGGIKRVFLEKVNGEYQGVVFRFTQGLKAGVNRLCWGPDGALYIGEAGMVGGWSWQGKRSGLQSIKYNGNSTFEILSIQSTGPGFLIEFTEPLAEEHGNSPLDYLVQQWWYLPTPSYGGPKMDLETLAISKLEMAEDRKSVNLVIPELKSGRVVYFRLQDDLVSAHGNHLWSGEAWYTLNNRKNEIQ